MLSRSNLLSGGVVCDGQDCPPVPDSSSGRKWLATRSTDQNLSSGVVTPIVYDATEGSGDWHPTDMIWTAPEDMTVDAHAWASGSTYTAYCLSGIEISIRYSTDGGSTWAFVDYNSMFNMGSVRGIRALKKGVSVNAGDLIGAFVGLASAASAGYITPNPALPAASQNGIALEITEV